MVVGVIVVVGFCSITFWRFDEGGDDFGDGFDMVIIFFSLDVLL